MSGETVPRIEHCRVCGSPLGAQVLKLGRQALTGVFVKDGAAVPRHEISLSMCGDARCGLVQLDQVYNLDDLFGEGYGYASGVNPSMTSHLREKALDSVAKVYISDGDVIVDIGSNDATTLSFYPRSARRIGVDPSGKKFSDKYEAIGAELVAAFFPSEAFTETLGEAKAKLVTSYSCFYDLPDPVAFAKGVAAILALDGIWRLEQSYMPTMLATKSFDTVCHEHIEYYRLMDIDNICATAGLKVIDVGFNDINGGSFTVDAVRKDNPTEPSPTVDNVLRHEKETDWEGAFAEFRASVDTRREDLRALLLRLKAEGKRVCALGASTKGNVLLQHYGLGPDLIESIGEVSAAKFGCQTPGTAIPIVPESELLASNPDYLIVLPWHFRSFFMNAPKFSGRRLIFPLPEVEIVVPADGVRLGIPRTR